MKWSESSPSKFFNCVSLLKLLYMFSFDRSAFKAIKAEDHKNDLNFWKKKTVFERLSAAYYLNSIAFDFQAGSEPEIDRTFFEARKRE